MAITENFFAWPVRVYYQDTDAQGVVYHGKYLDFFERARTEVLRELDIEPSQIHQEFGCILMIRKCEITYHAPALVDELLTATSQCIELKAASMVLAQKVLRDETLLADGQVEIVCVSETGRPVRIPKKVREAIGRYL